MGGNVEVGGDIRRQRFESPNSNERRFDRERIDERLGVDVAGFFVRPNLLTFGVGVTGGFRQGWRDSSDGTLGNDNGRLLDFDADLQLFRDRRLSFLVYGRRFDDNTNQSIGTDTESSGTTFGSVARLNVPLLPSSFTWQQRETSTESFGGSLRTKRDESRQLLEYSGQRVTNKGQFRVRLRQEDVDDRSVPAVGDYRIREGTALIARRWGPYQERTWQTSGRYFERNGRFDFRSASADTVFGWQATESLDLNLQHQFGSFDASGVTTTTQNATLSFGHELYESLSSKLRIFGHDVDQEGGSRRGYGGDLGFQYRKKLPWASLLRMDARARYERDDNRLASGAVPVIGESLTLVGATLNFLANRRIDPLSIQVFDGANGPLLSEGVDYVITSFGDRVSIEPLPGGQVAIGSVLVVNYSFAADPSAEIETTGYRFGIGLRRKWLGIRYDHDQTEEKQLSGSGIDLLQDSTRDSFRLELQHTWSQIEASASAAYAIDRSVSIDFHEWELSQALQWSPLPSVDIGLNLREGARNFSKPKRATDRFTASGWLNWRPFRDARVRIYGEHRRFNDTLSPDQRELEVGIRGRLLYGRIEVLPIFAWKQTQRGESTLEDFHAALRLRRSF